MDYYKKQRRKDAEIGREISRLWREFNDERNYLKTSGKEPDEETVQYIGQLAKQIKELSEQPRFRREFPSFAALYRFVRKEGVTLEDIKEE
jgi:thymidylate synthase